MWFVDLLKLDRDQFNYYSLELWLVDLLQFRPVIGWSTTVYTCDELINYSLDLWLVDLLQSRPVIGLITTV